MAILDASGNDLVKGIDVVNEVIVKPDFYTLEVVSEPLVPNYSLYPYPSLEVYIYYNHYYLLLRTSSNRNYKPASKLIFKLKCPHIFGDDNVHEVVTYWKAGNKPTKSRICYLIELEGKEFTQITYEEYKQLSRATIVLDR